MRFGKRSEWLWRKTGGVAPLALCLWALSAPPLRAQEAGNIFQRFQKPMSAPDFALKDLDGKEFDLRSHRNNVVFLNFWATW